MGRLLRNKKILRQAEERAKKKAQCLMSEMGAAGDLEGVEDCPAADAGYGLTPLLLESIYNMDQSVDGLFDPPVVAGSS